MNSEPISNLISQLARLPGIGRKTAQRLAYFILSAEDGYAHELADAVIAAKDNAKFCGVCFNITTEDPCKICSDDARDKSVICVVSDAKDIIAIERTGRYKGRYHVLGGVISPMDSVGPEELKIKELISRMDGSVEEVILATGLNVEGETTAMYIARLLKTLNVKTTRIARGIPAGSELMYADEATLSNAIEERRVIN